MPYKREKELSGSISPSGRLHPGKAADRASGDILFPDSLHQLCHGHAGKTCLEALVPLEGKDQFQVPGLCTVVKETVVADLLEPLWEHMQEEPPDELAAAYGDGAFRVPRFQAPCPKGDFRLRNGKNAAVGDGDLMGIPAQVLDGVTETVKRLLDEGTPVPAVKAVPESLPAGRFPESVTGSREEKGAILIEPVQEGKVLPLELVPQDKDRQEELSPAPADPAVRGKAAAGEDTVHMHMVEYLLVPGMEYLDDAGLGAQVFFVGA